jgi:hypothetical protein
LIQQHEQRESVGRSFINDTPSLQDSLGFEPYIKGVANFLKDPATSAPLTVSIEGEWGSGKSSFMKQLQIKLKQETPSSYSVWFDSWKYNKQEEIWAAFALSFLQQISNQRSWIIRPWLRRRLRWKRLQKNDSKLWVGIFKALPIGLIDLLFICFLVLVPIIYFGTVAKPIFEAFTSFTNIELVNQPATEFAIKLVPLFPWLIIVIKELRGTVSSLLERNLTKYINNPRYEDHLSFINQFHEDFRLMIENYASNNRVYLFIDDLDRCDAGKAADLMQAINMMIHDHPQVIFIIAMDRNKVAAGYAMHHEKLLTYLNPASLDENGRVDPILLSQRGLEYGYSYIEKFIQVPFKVPKPGSSDISSFLNLLESEPLKRKRTFKLNFPNKLLGVTRFINKRDSNTIKSTFKNQVFGGRLVHQDNLRVLLDNNDSVAIKKVISLVAPYLDNNPRKIKQFINIFRLYAYLSDELGLLNNNNKGIVSGLTLEQLGKVVAISIRWPHFITQAISNDEFIKLYLKYVYGGISHSEASYCGLWRNEQNIINLLLEGCEKTPGLLDPDLYRRFGIVQESFVKLFKIAEPVFRLEVQGVKSPSINFDNLKVNQFVELVIDLLGKYFDIKSMEILREENWGKTIKLILRSEEAIIVDIEKMFDVVDVHSIEYIKEKMDGYGVVKGIAITQGRFENAAISFAKGWNIELWDGIELTNILKRYGYNVVSDSIEGKTAV